MLKFFSSIIFIIGSFLGITPIIPIPPNSTPEIVELSVVEDIPIMATSSANSEFDAIKSKSIPSLLEKIADCESNGRQFNSDGSVLRGKVNSSDVGRWQINLDYHGEKAAKLGFDLMTLEGNTAYALWLYNHEGEKHWFASIKCWGKNPNYQ